MSDPTDDGGDPNSERDVSTITAALGRTGAKGLSLAISTLHRSIEILCIAAGLTGLMALTLGAWAWHNSVPGAAIALLAGVPTITVAAYVLVRIRALARALHHPAEALAQAQDLVVRAKGSPELHRLATGVRQRKLARRAGLGRLRRAVQTGQLISAVIGLAEPDPVRHDLVIPFTPDRVRNLWLAISVGLWAWLISAVMTSVALLSLAVGSL